MLGDRSDQGTGEWMAFPRLEWRSFDEEGESLAETTLN